MEKKLVKKLLLVCDSYDPTSNSASIQLYDLVEQLNLQNIEVVVFTQTKLRSIEGIDYKSKNLIILRVYNPLSYSKRYALRIIGEALLPFKLYIKVLQKKIQKYSWDGVIWYSPSIFAGIFIFLNRKNLQCNKYLILRDIFPQWAYDLKIIKSKFIFHVLNVVAGFQYRQANIIGVQSGGNIKYVDEQLKGNQTKVEILNNWLNDKANFSLTKMVDEHRDFFKSRKIFVYAGNFGVAQDLELWVKTAHELRNSRGIGFLFIGHGSEENNLRNIIEKYDTDNIVLMDTVPNSELMTILEYCSVGIVSLNLQHLSHNIPGKFITYLRAGLPTICNVNKNNDMIPFVRKNSIGEAVSTSNEKELAKICLHMASDNQLTAKGDRAKNIFRTHYSASIAANQIIDHF